MSSANGKLLPDSRRNRRVHVREQRLLERELGPARQALGARSARRGSRGSSAPAGSRLRAGAGVRTTPAIVVPSERRGEAREPVLARRVRVLAREDESLPASELRPEVARSAMVELVRGIVMHACAQPSCALGASVARSRSRRRRPRPRSSMRWRAIASRQRTRSVPPFLTGMTTEITRAVEVGVRRLATQRHGQEREEERAEDDLDPEPERRDEQGRLVRASERAEAVRRPFDADCDEARDRRAAKSAPPMTRPCSSVRWRPRRSSRRSRSPIRTRAYVRAKTPSWIDLRADERHRDEAEHRVDLPRVAEDVDRAGREHDHAGDPEERGGRSRDEVQPARAVQEHEAHVAPRVAEAVQLRLADPRVVVDRDLADGRARGGTP